MDDWFRIDGERLQLNIKVVPGSSRTEFAGVNNGRLRIRIAAIPEDGRANNELIAFLAKFLNCAKKEIVLQSGERSRQKTLSLPGSVQQKIEHLIERNPGNK
ncbi:MAG: DUF167 domain-containing protein [Treponema sp.]|nr:DUF167 domain-containing protein [Treponema sp.]